MYRNELLFCLVEQEFVKDNDFTIAKYTDKIAKELGGKEICVTIKGTSKVPECECECVYNL